MKPNAVKPDRTRNDRQVRRREREKQWLKENGWQSWEALHTALMNGSICLTPVVESTKRAVNNWQVSSGSSNL